MVAVKTGAPMVPMGGMPMGGMPMGGAPQPNNMMPPQMPLQPVPPIGQPFPMQQGSSPIPPNANRRKRFGDSLETMLASNIRPAAPVASDQMGGMNVFTGQMMNTARPPVVGMRGGGIVRHMRRGGSSFADYAGVNKNRNITSSKPTVSKASQIVSNQLAEAQKDNRPSYDFSVSPGDDRPPPVVTAPVVPMDFGDDNNYTPTSAELNQQLLDIGAPDKRFDVVPGGVNKIYGGMGDLDAADIFREGSDTEKGLYDLSAETAFDSQYPRSSTILPPETGGIAAIRSRQPFPDELSLQTPFNNTAEAEAAAKAAQEASFTQPSDPLRPFGGSGPDISIPKSYVGSGMNPANAYIDPLEPFGGAGEIINLGIGDPELVRPKIRPEVGGQGGTDTGKEDDMTIKDRINKMIKDFAAVPGNIARDAMMGFYAGLYGNDYDKARENLRNAKNPDGSRKYSDDQINAWVEATKITKQRQKDMQGPSTTEDGTVGGVGVVDPCPAGMRLDPVAGICVPIEEGEDEGPSLDLNRSRDDEFNELDDIMKKIVKPVGDTDDVRTMQAGGSVGLNRVADNFLAAMGG